jgi:hypothetical protein
MENAMNSIALKTLAVSLALCSCDQIVVTPISTRMATVRMYEQYGTCSYNEVGVSVPVRLGGLAVARSTALQRAEGFCQNECPCSTNPTDPRNFVKAVCNVSQFQTMTDSQTETGATFLFNCDVSR